MILVSIVSFDLAVPVLLGVFGGRWLDGKWETAPLFLIIGVFIGLIAGVYAVVTSMRKWMEDSDE